MEILDYPKDDPRLAPKYKQKKMKRKKKMHENKKFDSFPKGLSCRSSGPKSQKSTLDVASHCAFREVQIRSTSIPGRIAP